MSWGWVRMVIINRVTQEDFMGGWKLEEESGGEEASLSDIWEVTDQGPLGLARGPE